MVLHSFDCGASKMLEGIVSAEKDDGLEMNFTPMKGIIDDIRRRAPHYINDYTAGFHPKVLASTLFLFFACLANAIAFGALTGAVTGNEIGTVEMIAATAVGGIVFAVFSGQPLTILGGTGPIVIFTGLLYQVCASNDIPFLPVYAWVGIWSRDLYDFTRGVQYQCAYALLYAVYRRDFCGPHRGDLHRRGV